MPTVERVRGRGLVHGIGRFETGDRAEVSEDEAEYLVKDNGDFQRVEGDTVETDPAEDESEDDSEDESESEDEHPVRVLEYTQRGKCGYFDPEEMDDPCARSAGWGRDSDDGPCKTHVDELRGE